MLTYKMSSESSPGYPECAVSCHGAGRFANSIRGINENAGKCFYRCRNVGKRLSSCHLNKQRLINPLEAEVNESMRLIESMGVTTPYKISRFHRESPLAAALPPARVAKQLRLRLTDLKKHMATPPAASV